MTPVELKRLARDIGLEEPHQLDISVAFGVACIERVEQLLIDDSIIEALATGKAYIAGECDRATLQAAAATAAEAARSHPGTSSLDGAGSAAVSTSFGVAAALAGRALEAAGYAAYASVYSYASHAVTDIAAYKDEHDWQLSRLKMLAGRA